MHSLPLPYECSIYLSAFPDIATRSFREAIYFDKLSGSPPKKILRKEGKSFSNLTTMIMSFMQGKDTQKND